MRRDLQRDGTMYYLAELRGRPVGYLGTHTFELGRTRHNDVLMKLDL